MGRSVDEGSCAMKGQTNEKILKPKLQRRLRKNPTDAEQRLWACLRGRQMGHFKFRRQHPFGDYVIDFVCLEAMLAVEADGGQHAEMRQADALRTKNLTEAGFEVLRFWNNDVLRDIEAVKESIWLALQKRCAPSGLSGVLCVRHIMSTERNMNAQASQEDAKGQCGCTSGGVAEDTTGIA
jgi:very-short-patch-repair endonuclease